MFQLLTGFQRVIQKIAQKDNKIFLTNRKPGQIIAYHRHGDLAVTGLHIFLIQYHIHDTVVCIDAQLSLFKISCQVRNISKRFFLLSTLNQSLNTVQFIPVVMLSPPLLFIVLFHILIQTDLILRTFLRKPQLLHLGFLLQQIDHIVKPNQINCRKSNCQRQYCIRIFHRCHAGRQAHTQNNACQRKKTDFLPFQIHKPSHPLLITITKQKHQAQITDI